MRATDRLMWTYCARLDEKMKEVKKKLNREKVRQQGVISGSESEDEAGDSEGSGDSEKYARTAFELFLDDLTEMIMRQPGFDQKKSVIEMLSDVAISWSTIDSESRHSYERRSADEVRTIGGHQLQEWNVPKAETGNIVERLEKLLKRSEAQIKADRLQELALDSEAEPDTSSSKMDSEGAIEIDQSGAEEDEEQDDEEESDLESGEESDTESDIQAEQEKQPTGKAKARPPAAKEKQNDQDPGILTQIRNDQRI